MRTAYTLLLAALLTGCAAPYAPNGLSGGYSETRRADDIYVVRFTGNGFTKPEDAEEMAFLRAAELTRDKGFKYFSILSESNRSTNNAVSMPSQSYTTGSVNPWGGFQARTTTTPGAIVNVQSPNATLHIGMTNTKFTAERVFYEAQSVVDDLGKKYRK